MRSILFFIVINIFFTSPTEAQQTCHIDDNIPTNYLVDTACVGDTILFEYLYDETLIINPTFNWSGLLSCLPELISMSSDSSTIVVMATQPYDYLNATAQGCYGILAIPTVDTLCAVFPVIRVILCPPESGFIAMDRQLCSGECVEFVAQSLHAPEVFYWEFEGGNPSFFVGREPPPICYEQSGSYGVSLAVGNGAGGDTMYMADYIEVLETPAIAQADTLYVTVAQGDAITLASCGIAAYNAWYQEPQEALLCENCDVFSWQVYQNTLLRCDIYDDSLCRSSCYYALQLAEVLDACDVPTGFSPNGDGMNDTFYAMCRFANVIRLKIYDRWGKLVYAGVGNTAVWRGNYESGEAAEMGVYSWVLEYEQVSDNAIKTKAGAVTLIR
ncbi:MAG: gliding motility-associated C-terminal domain-containing protein [Sphingobacteriales bacterium]|nr:gliding motility-associated C-terminal domain-containing protein [Sphingobacteriales bacterium]